MTHTPECLHQTALAEQRRNEWILLWPNYCLFCGGRGEFEYTDLVPYGDTNVSMPGSEFCEHCLGTGRCPRCGQSDIYYGNSEQELTCKVCGWCYDDHLPDQHECFGECREP